MNVGELAEQVPHQPADSMMTMALAPQKLCNSSGSPVDSVHVMFLI